MKTLWAVASAVAAISLAGAASASMIPLVGSGPSGSFSGTASYSAINATSGTLTLTLTNTSVVSNGGFLTGVAVELLPGTLSGSLLSTTDSDFVGLTNFTASPFGAYDVGAATGGNWEGGGPPSRGIAVGASVTLVFSVSGVGAGTYDVSDLDLGGTGRPTILARFRGFEDGASDKVPAVPAPGAIALAGLAAAVVGRRRR